MKRRLTLWCAATTVAWAMAAVISPLETGASVLASHTLGSESPQQILAKARVAAVSQKTFVASCSSGVPSAGLSGTTTTHIATTAGWQVQTAKVQGNPTAARGEVRFLGGVVYLNGNARFLELQFTVKSSKYAGRWVAIKKGQLDYGQLSGGMSMQSALQQLSPVGKLAKSGVHSFAGMSVVPVKGTASPALEAGKGTATLYVGTAKPFLPVGLAVHTTISGHAVHVTCTFGHWKAAVTVVKPSSSTPINKTDL